MHTANITISESGDMHDDLKPLVESGDEYVDIEVLVDVHVAKMDFGVPRSPTWLEIDFFVIDDITVNGVSMMFTDFEKKWGNDICNVIYEITEDRLNLEDLH